MRHTGVGAHVGLLLSAIALWVIAATAPTGAVSRSAALTTTVTIGALAKVSLSSTAVAFPDANPDTVPQIQAAGGAITITAKTRTTAGSAVILAVMASDDLRAGTATIPVSAVSWTTTGAGFVPGTMSRSVAATVASWVGSGVRSGTQLYRLANSWTYATGTYSATFTYTLSAP